MIERSPQGRAKTRLRRLRRGRRLWIRRILRARARQSEATAASARSTVQFQLPCFAPGLSHGRRPTMFAHYQSGTCAYLTESPSPTNGSGSWQLQARTKPAAEREWSVRPWQISFGSLVAHGPRPEFDAARDTRKRKRSSQGWRPRERI